MKKLLVVVCLILVALPAVGDGTATLIRWPGWECASTEDLSLGRKHTSFPLTYLFDGNPGTPWVFSGTGKHELSGRKGYALHLSREEGRKPVTVDSIWIMNGYNKSQGLFLRNNRIIELKLYVNEKLLETVSLTDCMGWHKISIPRRAVRDIYLRFTKFAKGKDNDVCVSELALYDQGKKIDMKMPKIVEFTEGDVDCGDGQEFYVIDRTGKRLERYDMDPPAVWSPSGRYIAEVGYTGELWIWDSTTCKLLVRKSMIATAAGYAWSVKWRGNRSVVVDIAKYKPGMPKDAYGEFDTTALTKTVTIPVK